MVLFKCRQLDFNVFPALLYCSCTDNDECLYFVYLLAFVYGGKYEQKNSAAKRRTDKNRGNFTANY